MLGAAHTLWNVGQHVLLKYWGDPKDSADTGAWKSWVALGGTSEKPVSKKDFSSIMEIIHKVHTATLVFLLQYVQRFHIILDKEYVRNNLKKMFIKQCP